MLLFLALRWPRSPARHGGVLSGLLFGLTIIAGVSGKSLIKGVIAACLGLLISCVGADPMTSYDRFTFGIPRLYLGLDLADRLIGLFALVEIMAKAERSGMQPESGHRQIKDDGKITKDEYKRMFRPVLMSSIIGSMRWHHPWHRCIGGLVVHLQHAQEPVQASGGIRPRFCGGRCGRGVGQQRRLAARP